MTMTEKTSLPELRKSHLIWNCNSILLRTLINTKAEQIGFFVLLSQRPDDKMSDEQLEQLAPWSETAKTNCQN